MKRLFIILFCFLICSCYRDDEPYPLTKAERYFWYTNSEIFKNSKCCQVIGEFQNQYNNKVNYVNLRYNIYNDTIYLKTRHNSPEFIYFKGTIIVNNIDYPLDFKLN